MGVQATMLIGRKSAASAVVTASAAAGYPPANSVSIISLPTVAQAGQTADIYRAIMLVIDWVRDTRQFNSAGSSAFVTSLTGGKAGVLTRSIATDVVDGDFGLMVVGSVRNLGNRLDTETAHKQLLDWMREKGRLSV